MSPDTRAHVHELIDHLPPGQLAAIETLLESMIEDEELTEEDRRALRASDEYFRNGGEGIPFEQVVDDRGFTMDQIRTIPQPVASSGGAVPIGCRIKLDNP